MRHPSNRISRKTSRSNLFKTKPHRQAGAVRIHQYGASSTLFQSRIILRIEAGSEISPVD
ncbi:hypothetical protein D8666_09200 [Ochrobactrum soli]|uniref:Uncharacterized protein n=1 Tax=Ochrobactrum soli TaxID=2448455 RepID=A0A2P9HLE5_9HYPH|nr:hypothetical protein D8666_09200 [[Ochrobactrum] soli]SPL64650.1 hypothetical protein OHAE_517 [[Ochrobactrum] soli]